MTLSNKIAAFAGCPEPANHIATRRVAKDDQQHLPTKRLS